MTLRDGKSPSTARSPTPAIALLDIGFAPERVAKIVGKEAAHIKARPECSGIRRSAQRAATLTVSSRT